MLRLGDQVRAVDDAPLVRESLASLLQRRFADRETVTLHISRASGPAGKHRGDAFAALQLRDADGEELDEWLSELYELKSKTQVWGTFWTLSTQGVRSVWLGLHLSKMFTEPLIGGVELKLDDLPAETISTRWYSLRAEGTAPNGRDIEGEVLLTVRKFYSTVSISPDGEFSDDSADEPEGPIDHATAPLQPIPEPP